MCTYLQQSALSGHVQDHAAHHISSGQQGHVATLPGAAEAQCANLQQQSSNLDTAAYRSLQQQYIQLEVAHRQERANAAAHIVLQPSDSAHGQARCAAQHNVPQLIGNYDSLAVVQKVCPSKGRCRMKQRLQVHMAC